MVLFLILLDLIRKRSSYLTYSFIPKCSYRNSPCVPVPFQCKQSMLVVHFLLVQNKQMEALRRPVITPRITKKGKNTLEAELIHDGGWLEQNCLGEKVTMT